MLSPGKPHRCRSELKRKRVRTMAKFQHESTYGGQDEEEGCSDGTGSLDPVKAYHHVRQLGELKLGRGGSLLKCVFHHLSVSVFFFFRNKDQRLNLVIRGLGHIVHLLKVFGLETQSSDGEAEPHDQPGGVVHHSDDQSPHLHWVV